MSRFWENAATILETAESIHGAGSLADAPDGEWTILFGPGGGIQMLAANDWPLHSLAQHHGARMVYRVSRQDGAVRVAGRAGSRACLLESAKPNWAARVLPADRPQYDLVPALLSAA